jgi:DNA-binding XRE family transcriptional regulator
MSENRSKNKISRHSVSILIEVSASSQHELQGKIIRLLRINKGWSQQQLADLLGVSRGAVIDIEKRGATDGIQLFAIADILDVDIDIFKPSQ